MGQLYIFCGIPFSGKTTIAREVASKLNFVRVDLDDIKFKLFGSNITDEEIDQTGWDRIYTAMYQEIEQHLRSGKTVISDTGNFTKAERQSLIDIARKVGVSATEVFIDTPLEVARQRWEDNKASKERFDISEKSFMSAVAEMEPPEAVNSLAYKYPDSVQEWIETNFSDK